MTLIDIIIVLIVFGLAVLALKKVLRDKAQGQMHGLLRQLCRMLRMLGRYGRKGR